jgi:hypothetical protein
MPMRRRQKATVRAAVERLLLFEAQPCSDEEQPRMIATSTSVSGRKPKVDTWAQFHRIVKQPGRPLLARLGRFPNSVLVAGCQRSGTTAVRRLLAKAKGVGAYRIGNDDELDAALLLSGYVDRGIDGRGCFQTTYLNDRYPEYFDHSSYRLVWILRDPASVVHSMLYNWRRAALKRLFDACGASELPARSSGFFGLPLASRLEMACASYVGKTRQTFELAARLGGDRLIVLDYDELVLDKARLVPKLFEFAELPYEETLADTLHAHSVQRGHRLSPAQQVRVDELCTGVYREARALAAARRASI